MEAKLAEYRTRKLNQERQSKTVGQRLFAIFGRTREQVPHSQQNTNLVTSPGRSNTCPVSGPAGSANPSTSHAERDTDNHSHHDDEDNDCDLDTDLPSAQPGKYDWLLLALKAVLWGTVWLIFIELQFGAVFFALSALVFVYWNTAIGRGGRAKFLSAYSVFNPRCQRLQGTITAEQFEAELLHRKPLEST